MLNFDVSVHPPIQEWSDALTLNQKQINTATVRALNKTARWANAQLASRTAKKTKVKVASVKDFLTIQKASMSSQKIVVGMQQRAGVIKVYQMGNATQNARGVKVGRRQFDSAFIAQMPTGHQGVFKRKRKTRLPIQEVQIVITAKLRDEMDLMHQQELRSHFGRLLQRELNYFIRG